MERALPLTEYDQSFILQDGETALMNAAYFGETDYVRCLLAAGASPDLQVEEVIFLKIIIFFCFVLKQLIQWRN